MKSIFSLVLLCLAVSTASFAQSQTSTQRTPVVQAFEHYELVRTALAADNLTDAAPHAKALADTAEAAGGAPAKKAADALAAAKNLEDARKQFGELSTILVPVFQAEAIPGTSAYMCPMKQKPWMQRGDKMANPYYGRAMLTCGTVLPPKAK
jgi:hypothetical protein